MPVDLGFAATLAPAKAIEYFESKGYVIGFNWHDVEDSAQATGFTVAGILKQDVLADVQNGLADALKNGKTLAQFQAELMPTLERKGWIGKGLKADPQTGELEGKKLLPYRMETIFRTNMQSSYAAGRYQRMMENVAFRPFWEYDAIMDNLTRPAHAALNKRVFRYDDPIWDVIFPPNGYRCRCNVRALNQRELDKHAIGLESSEDRMEWIEQPYGQDDMRRVLAYRDPKTGNIFTPDAGFHQNPGRGYLSGLGDQLLRKGDIVAPRLAALAADEVMNQPKMLTEYTRDIADWVRMAHADTRLQSEWRYAGALKPALLDSLAAQPVSAVVRIEGETLGNVEQLDPVWLRLPALLAHPDVVLQSADGTGFIYVMDKLTSGTPRLCQVAMKNGVPVVSHAAPLADADIAELKRLPVLMGKWADE
jgi:SPP1 gp7 family putative phage head morphogenesis protein